MLKSYPTKKTVPQRMTRKRMRQDVFQHNRKAAKLRRKATRLARIENEANNEQI